MAALELWSYTFRDAPLACLAVAAGAAGFSHITCTPGQFRRDGGPAADLRRRAADAGVLFSVIDGLCSELPGTPPPARRDGSFSDPHEARFDDVVPIAHALGAGTISLVHLGGVAISIERLAEAFAALCRRARSEGLRLAIEFVPATGIPDLRTCAAIVRTAGESNGFVLLDTWHFARGGGTLADLDPTTAALIGGLQLADRSPEQDRERYVPMRGRKLPGDGALPLAEITRRILAAHPDLPVGVEILSDEMDAFGLAEGSRRAAQSCRAMLEAMAD